MARILDRYVLREMMPPFVAGAAVFTFVLLMSQFLRLVEMIVNKGVAVSQALRLIAYLLPSILVMTVPMALLLGSLAAFGRLSADNEITALKSAGCGLSRLGQPVAVFSCAVFLLTFVLIDQALPRGNQAFRSLMFEIVRGKATIGFKERVFNDDFDGLIIYVNEIPQGANPVMKGVMIHDYRSSLEDPRQEPVTIFAQEGLLLADGGDRDVVFRLKRGSIHRPGSDRLKFEQINFRLHDLRLSMQGGLAGAATLPKGLREMSVAELLAKEAEYRGKGLPTAPALVELHKKFAIPGACFVFGFLGLGLGILFRKGEKMVAFVLCVGVVILYYIFLIAGEPMGKQGLVPPWLSMWAANLFLGLLTIILLWVLGRERMPAAGLAAAISRRLGRREGRRDAWTS